MHMAGIALYSSSPPAVWSTQCSLSSSTTAVFDNDVHGRITQQSNSGARPLIGGLSGLFASSTNRPSNLSPCSHGDGVDYNSFNSGSGMVRSSSLTDLCHNGSAWECESRSGSISIPVASSCRLKERSPVSVLHAPFSRSSLHNSPIYSLIARDSAVSAVGLPPLDPHLERHSRRRGAPSVEERWPISRSVGFEVVGDGSFGNCQARLWSPDSSASGSNPTSPEDDRNNMSRHFTRKDGFLRPLTSNEVLEPEKQDLLEARKRLTRLAQSPVPTSTSTSGSLASTADELLADAQARHKIFHDPLVIQAFEVAEEAHRNQMRRNGDLYLAHCVETAILLADTGADSTVVAAGLLHDTLDDSSLVQEQIRATFGSEIEYLVAGVSKLSTFSQLARDNQTACNPVEADRLRTMFLAMVDVRVVLIKLADRLHNLRTLDVLTPVKQLRIADETLEIFAPLANRLGIWSWKAEIEDICFKYLKPLEYTELATKMAQGWQQGAVLSSIQQLDEALRLEGLEITDICGRPKNLYSIYRKMQRKSRSIDEIFDVRGMRLIVRDEASCYAALEVVHRIWAHIPKKFKDYISQPKANGYQSLHTVILGEDGHPLEVQIRTMEMHHQAEYGMAAHWRYKENNSKHSSFLLQKVEWARWVLTWHSEILDTKLRVSPLGVNIRPPCPFPVHQDDCPYALGCSLPPPQSDDDPLFVIVVEDENMIVQELPPGSTPADLLAEKSSDRDSVSVSSTIRSRKWSWPKVNHQLVENFQQKLRMGDLVELSSEQEIKPLMVPGTPRELEVVQPHSGKPCGKIALEFQREQLKRLYLEGVRVNEEARRGPRTATKEQRASIARFS